MARKPKHEEHENHERWLVSYADFITLLFAFFVVMYAISSVNEGKYRVLSSALVKAFSHPQKTMEPIQYGNPLRAPIIQHDSMIQDQNALSRMGIDHQIIPTAGEMAGMQKLADQLEYNLKDLIDQKLITVTKTNLGLEIEIKSNVLFASGMANLSQQALPPLKKIAAILSKTSNEINVEGYTDDVPISTPSFPSNWELSAARAASVVRLFTQSGVEPVRLKAIGFAEFRPVADNSTELGRSKNRRVTIFVLNKADEKRVNLSLEAGSEVVPKSASKLKIIDTHFPINLPPRETVPVVTLDSSSVGENDADKIGDRAMLLPSNDNAAITTLPPGKVRSYTELNNKFLSTSAHKTTDKNANKIAGKNTKSPDKSLNVKPVKPSQPIKVPKLQLLPISNGAQQ